MGAPGIIREGFLDGTKGPGPSTQVPLLFLWLNLTFPVTSDIFPGPS